MVDVARSPAGDATAMVPGSPTATNNPNSPTVEPQARPAVTAGVTSTLQSNLVELISRALGSALEPVAKLENEYDLITEQNLQYKDTNHQLNEMLLAAQANINERDKLNRELRHQKNKLEEQHDRLLREKRRLDAVDDKLKASQQQLLDERRQAGLRQDNNERQLTDNTIRIEELSEEATQYKHQLNKAKLEKKELQKQHKEKDELIKQKDTSISDKDKEIQEKDKDIKRQEDLAQQMQVREAETILKLNTRVSDLEGDLKEQTESRAKDQVKFNKEMLDLKDANARTVHEKEQAAEDELREKNSELHEVQEKLRKQAEIVKSSLEEKEKAITAKEKAERMFGRMAEEHNVQSSELQIMTEHSSRWETQVKEKTKLVENLNTELAALHEDLAETRKQYETKKEEHNAAKQSIDNNAALHKEALAAQLNTLKAAEEMLRAAHIDEVHNLNLVSEKKMKDLANELISKTEHITKIESELSGVKHAHSELVSDMKEVSENHEKDTLRFSKRTAELEKALEKEGKDRAADKTTAQTEIQGLKSANAVIIAENEATVQAVKSKLLKTQADVADKEKAIQKLTDKIAEMNVENDSLQDSAFESEKSLKRLTAEHNHAKEELATLTEAKSSIESDLARGKNRVRVLETKLGQAQEDMNKMKQANIKLRQTVGEKQKQHDELHKLKNNELTQLIKQHNSEKEKLKTANGLLSLEKQKERETLANDADAVKTKKDFDIRQLEKAIIESQTESEHLKAELKEVTSKSQQDSTRLEDRLAEVDKLLKRELEERASDQISFQDQIQVLKDQNSAALTEEEEESKILVTSIQAQLTKVEARLKDTELERDELFRKHEDSAKERDRAQRTLSKMEGEYSMQFDQLTQQTEQSSTLETRIHAQVTDLKNKEIAISQQDGNLSVQTSIVEQLKEQLDDAKAQAVEKLAQKDSDIQDLQRMLDEEEEEKHKETERAEQAEHALDRRSKAFNKELEAKQQKLREMYEVMEASAVSYQVQGKDTGDTLEDLKLPLIRESLPTTELDKPRRPAAQKQKGFAKRLAGRTNKNSDNQDRESRSR